MSYDLFLVPAEGRTLAECEAALDAHPFVERTEDDDFVFESGRTLTSFVMSLDSTHLAVEIPYLQPFSCADEAGDFLLALCDAAGLEVEQDPQIDGIEGRAFDLAAFLRGWLAGNAFAYRSVIGARLESPSDEPFPPSIPSVQLQAVWGWNRDEDLATFAGGCEVGLIQLAEDEVELFTLGLLHLGRGPVLVPIAEVYALFVGDEPVRFVKDDDVRDILDPLPRGPEDAVLATQSDLEALVARSESRGISTLHPKDVCELELVEHAIEALRRDGKAVDELYELAGVDPAPDVGEIRTVADVIFALHRGVHRNHVVYPTPRTAMLRVPGQDRVLTPISVSVDVEDEGIVVRFFAHLPLTGAELQGVGATSDGPLEEPGVFAEEALLVELDGKSIDERITRLAARVEHLRQTLAPLA